MFQKYTRGWKVSISLLDSLGYCVSAFITKDKDGLLHAVVKYFSHKNFKVVNIELRHLMITSGQ